MPLIKDTLNLTELKPLCDSPDKPLSILYRFMNGKKSVSGLKSLEQTKSSGYSSREVLFLLLALPFLGQSNLHSFFQSSFSSLSKAKKDVYYRLKNNEVLNWRKILLGMAKEFMHRVGRAESEQESQHEVSAFVLDDTFLPKCGKLIEGVSMVWDHVVQGSRLGFKCLTLGYWEGKSMIPLDFSLHREKGKNKKRPFGLSLKKIREQLKKLRKKGSGGSIRKKELDTDKITNSIKMLKRAVKNGFKADYLLTDSWFVCEKLLVFVLSCSGIGHLVGQCKLDKRAYSYKGKTYNAKELKHLLRKNWKRARSLRMSYLAVVVEYKGIKIKLFFTRGHGQKKTRLLLSTHLSLSFIKAYRIYAIRWTIEVFFKEAKQLLGLGKCQSNDFDAQIADTTLAMIRYTILNFEKRIGAYQTLGGLFKNAKEQTRELLLSERIWGQMIQILTELSEFLGIDNETLVAKILNNSQFDQKVYKILHALCEQPPRITPNNPFFQKIA